MSEEEIYEVERIVKKKILPNGTINYLIKWKDYAETDNSWEPVEHLECQELITEFERNADPSLIEDLTKKNLPAKKNKHTPGKTVQTNKKSSNHKVNQKLQNNNQKSGFEEGLTVESILGATDAAGELMFLIKWKERNEASLISAKVANVKCPQQVLHYLQQKITFTADPKNDN